jgi:hypothetical protein
MRRAPSAISAEGRKVPLPDGRTLSIRFVERRDVDGLTALYAGLDPASNYRRFFSAFRPGRPFFERIATMGERPGAGLVATIGTGDLGDRIVAECGYEVLPNGNGELAITVDRAWRGWLGAYLLDALVDVAASRGVPNLEADILVTNGPMLALLRSRGYAIVPNADWNIVRAMIGTASPPSAAVVGRRRRRTVARRRRRRGGRAGGAGVPWSDRSSLSRPRRRGMSVGRRCRRDRGLLPTGRRSLVRVARRPSPPAPGGADLRGARRWGPGER